VPAAVSRISRSSGQSPPRRHAIHEHHSTFTPGARSRWGNACCQRAGALLRSQPGRDLGVRRTREAIAQVDGQIVTNEEVEDALGAPIRRLERQIYDLKRQKLDSLISQRLPAREAARRGVTTQALLQEDVTAKVEPGRLRGAEAQLRDQIRAYLQNQKLSVRRSAFLQSLRSEARVVVRLQEPPASRS
jgi:small-conductance mechanosensitive channel